MPDYRNVTATIERPDGRPWVGAVVEYTLRPATQIDGVQYPSVTVRSSPADENGLTTARLVVIADADFSAEYHWQNPRGESGSFTLEAGDLSDIDLSELRVLGVIPGDGNYTSLRAYVDTHLGGTDLDATGLAVDAVYRYDGAAFVLVPVYSKAEADAAFLSAAEGDAAFLTQAEGDARYFQEAVPDAFVAGDIPFMTAIRKLGRIAAVAAGMALVSAGVGAAPVYGKITSAHVDATLPTLAGAHTWTGSQTFNANQSLSAQRRLYFDGGGDTYLAETAANQLDATIGNTLMVRMLSTGVRFYGEVRSANHLTDNLGAAANRWATIYGASLDVSGNATTGGMLLTASTVSGGVAFGGSTASGHIYRDATTGDLQIVPQATKNVDVVGPMTVTGAASAVGGLTVDIAGSVQARLSATAADGLMVRGKAGSVTDLIFSNGAGATVMSVGAGSTSATFAGTLTSSTLAVTGTSTLTGNVGIGGAGNSAQMLRISGTHSSGAAQIFGVALLPTAPATATEVRGIHVQPSTVAAAFTITDMFHYYAQSATKGAGSSITNQYAYYVAPSFTAGSNNWAFYNASAAASHFGGAVSIAGALTVTGTSAHTGAATFASTVAVTGRITATDGININGVAGSAGRIYADATVGLSMRGVTGTTHDLAIIGATGSTVLRVPTGTIGMQFMGAVGFNAAAPLAKPTISGSRGGNAALADLLTKLATYGLITDGTSA